MLALIDRAVWRVSIALRRRASDIEHYGYGGSAWTGTR